MPKIPRSNPQICNFPKHKGKHWTQVAEEDPQYMEWLISFEGPAMTDEQYEIILEALEQKESFK